MFRDACRETCNVAALMVTSLLPPLLRDPVSPGQAERSRCSWGPPPLPDGPCRSEPRLQASGPGGSPVEPAPPGRCHLAAPGSYRSFRGCPVSPGQDLRHPGPRSGPQECCRLNSPLVHARHGSKNVGHLSRRPRFYHPGSTPWRWLTRPRSQAPQADRLKSLWQALAVYLELRETAST